MHTDMHPNGFLVTPYKYFIFLALFLFSSYVFFSNVFKYKSAHIFILFPKNFFFFLTNLNF